ncbi:hypothetical protein AVEN_188341-1 [Araneus ventricosus]|uniref:Uncharacterized protein n=1 Tax=Araneus ventricosus TaxID=182803 RepID=A0A4Y2VIA8_ARAVE|nr:hypothetical protein AVEN_188341-1 [Araneus ventricosus]
MCPKRRTRSALENCSYGLKVTETGLMHGSICFCESNLPNTRSSFGLLVTQGRTRARNIYSHYHHLGIIAKAWRCTLGDSSSSIFQLGTSHPVVDNSTT